jgi:single-strand DNA-binding protein
MPNEVKLSGLLTRDPEVRILSTGTSKVTFSIAHNTGKGENKKVHFFDCIAWKETGERIAEKYAKGKPIEIQGMLTQNSWETDGVKKSRVEIVVFKVVEKLEEPTPPPPPEDDDIPF